VLLKFTIQQGLNLIFVQRLKIAPHFVLMYCIMMKNNTLKKGKPPWILQYL